jgi:hypothetical protein
MQPNLINKNRVVKIISEFKKDIKTKIPIKIDNTNYFNLVVIFLIIILILFLIFRYIDKKNRSNNYNK